MGDAPHTNEGQERIHQQLWCLIVSWSKDQCILAIGFWKQDSISRSNSWRSFTKTFSFFWMSNIGHEQSRLNGKWGANKQPKWVHSFIKFFYHQTHQENRKFKEVLRKQPDHTLTTSPDPKCTNREILLNLLFVRIEKTWSARYLADISFYEWYSRRFKRIILRFYHWFEGRIFGCWPTRTDHAW